MVEVQTDSDGTEFVHKTDYDEVSRELDQFKDDYNNNEYVTQEDLTNDYVAKTVVTNEYVTKTVHDGVVEELGDMKTEYGAKDYVTKAVHNGVLKELAEAQTGCVANATHQKILNELTELKGEYATHDYVSKADHEKVVDELKQLKLQGNRKRSATVAGMTEQQAKAAKLGISGLNEEDQLKILQDHMHAAAPTITPITMPTAASAQEDHNEKRRKAIAADVQARLEYGQLRKSLIGSTISRPKHIHGHVSESGIIDVPQALSLEAALTEEFKTSLDVPKPTPQAVLKFVDHFLAKSHATATAAGIKGKALKNLGPDGLVPCNNHNKKRTLRKGLVRIVQQHHAACLENVPDCVMIKNGFKQTDVMYYSLTKKNLLATTTVLECWGKDATTKDDLPSLQQKKGDPLFKHVLKPFLECLICCLDDRHNPISFAGVVTAKPSSFIRNMQDRIAKDEGALYSCEGLLLRNEKTAMFPNGLGSMLHVVKQCASPGVNINLALACDRVAAGGGVDVKMKQQARKYVTDYEFDITSLLKKNAPLRLWKDVTLEEDEDSDTEEAAATAVVDEEDEEEVFSTPNGKGLTAKQLQYI